MDEDQWLRCGDPDAMLAFLGDRASDGQRRLFVLAWVRGSCHWPDGWPLGDAATEGACRHAVAVAERLVEGRATDAQREAAYGAASDIAAGSISWDLGLYYAAALAAATVAPLAGHVPDPPYLQAAWTQRKLAAEHAAQAALLREVVGNPFRHPRIDPAWRAWEGSTAVRLARQIDEGAFDLLPILGDALEEAGCDRAELLRDCRRPLAPAAAPGRAGRLGSLARALLKALPVQRVPLLGRYEGQARACRVAAAVLGRFDSLRQPA
jgi:hypothetical protein